MDIGVKFNPAVRTVSSVTQASVVRKECDVVAGRQAQDSVDISLEARAAMSQITEEPSAASQDTEFPTFRQELESLRQEHLNAVLSHYSGQHQENLTFDDPQGHIRDKYFNTSSSYFRNDMTESERAWAYSQETCLLKGGLLNLNDPYAYESEADVPNMASVAIQANQNCRTRIEQIFGGLLKENGIELPEDAAFRVTVSQPDYNVVVSGLGDKALEQKLGDMLSQNGGGERLYEHIRSCNPYMFGVGEPGQYSGTELSLDYADGHFTDVDTQYGYGPGQTDWQAGMQVRGCKISALKEALGTTWRQYTGKCMALYYDENKNKVGLAEDITELLEVVDIDINDYPGEFHAYQSSHYDRERYKPFLTLENVRQRAEVSESAARTIEAADAVLSEARDVIGGFFSGDISEDKLRTEYARLTNKFVEAYQQNQYPAIFAYDLYQNRCAEEEVFYDEFRKAILDTAVSLNNSAGEKYVTSPADGGLKYYNSDYYFKSESAIAAATKGARDVAAKWHPPEVINGVSQLIPPALRKYDYSFEIPDYKGEDLNSYYNFNSAWDSADGSSNQSISDYDKVPPRGFEWFYQYGGIKNSRPVQDAEENDPFAAVMWARYTDAKGKDHFTSTHYSCDHTAGDMQKVSELMSFANVSDIRGDYANKFMSYLKVYSLRDVSRLTSMASALNMFA